MWEWLTGRLCYQTPVLPDVSDSLSCVWTPCVQILSSPQMAGCLSAQRLVSCQSCGGERVTNLGESFLNCFCLTRCVCGRCCSIPPRLKSSSWHSLIHTLVVWLFYLPDLCLPVWLPLSESCSPSPDLALKWWHHAEHLPLSSCFGSHTSPAVFLSFFYLEDLLVKDPAEVTARSWKSQWLAPLFSSSHTDRFVRFFLPKLKW